MKPVAVVASCFGSRFGTPRQPGLAPAAAAEVRLVPPFDALESLIGLDGFSHVWLVTRFHANPRDSWSPTVRPPRLGGNQRMGVFATRSPYRPNPVGLSVVALEAVVTGPAWRGLRVRDHDLVDGTPVLDIKPYLPYGDCIPEAVAPAAFCRPEPRLAVRFAPELEGLHPLTDAAWRALVEQTLGADPRPAYTRDERVERRYGVLIRGFDVGFRVADGVVTVESVARVPPAD